MAIGTFDITSLYKYKCSNFIIKYINKREVSFFFFYYVKIL